MIYFIKMAGTDFVKIGYSESPNGRMRHLQTAHPHTLEILATVCGNMKMERAIHRHFAAEKVRGEWFHLAGRVEQFLGYICDGLDRTRSIGEERLLEAANKSGLSLGQYL